MKLLSALFFTFIVFGTIVSAQTTGFTYQGRLNDSSLPQGNGTYTMKFRLYDSETGGNQIGNEITSLVSVNDGIFTTTLDFNATSFQTGQARWLEVQVATFILSPRQPLTATPYAIRASSAQQADIALNSQKLGGITASEYVTTSNGGNSFIQNSTAQQSANFNVNGNGIVGGNLGIGTTNPGAKLEVRGAGIQQRITDNTSGNSLVLQGGSGSNMKVTGFNYNTFTAVPLYLSVDGANTIINNGGGNVGIGTNNPTLGKLHVNSIANSTNTIYALSSGEGGIGVYGENNNGGVGLAGFSTGSGIGVFGYNSGGGLAGRFDGDVIVFGDTTAVGSFKLSILETGGGAPVCRNSANFLSACSSSLRYKKDFQSFTDGLSFINQLRPITYKWKSSNAADVGFGAEDVARINPLFVTYNSKGEVEGVKYDRLSVVFVNAFKEQQAQIEQQQKQIKTQNQQNEEQKNINQNLQTKVEQQQLEINELKKKQTQFDELKQVVCSLKPDTTVCKETKK